MKPGEGHLALQQVKRAIGSKICAHGQEAAVALKVGDLAPLAALQPVDGRGRGRARRAFLDDDRAVQMVEGERFEPVVVDQPIRLGQGDFVDHSAIGTIACQPMIALEGDVEPAVRRYAQPFGVTACLARRRPSAIGAGQVTDAGDADRIQHTISPLELAGQQISPVTDRGERRPIRRDFEPREPANARVGGWHNHHRVAVRLSKAGGQSDDGDGESYRDCRTETH